MIFRQTISGIARTGPQDRAFDRDLAAAWDRLSDLVRQGGQTPPYLALPYRTDDLAEIESNAKRIGAYARDVVILGTGGSSLGGQALNALRPGRYDRATDDLRLHFCANLDPVQMDAMLSQLDWAHTHILAISKSGGTAETMSQLAAGLDALEGSLGSGAAGKHVTAITQPGDSALRRLAEQRSIPVLDHDPDLGGRYSVLSIVGLLPAAIAGLDVAAVRRGAAAVLDQAKNAIEPHHVPAVAAAAAAAYLAGQGRGCTVLMPYESRLERLAAWWQQLWAESLGKDGKGTTPIAALGPVDQHSQLQLYLDGPSDKFFTLVLQPTRGTGPGVNARLAASHGLDYLAGHTIGDLVEAEARATAMTLIGHGCPTRILELARLDELALGALFMQFMLETVVTAGLWRVNAFDQPAVEDGKILARQTLKADFANLEQPGEAAMVCQV